MVSFIWAAQIGPLRVKFLVFYIKIDSFKV